MIPAAFEYMRARSLPEALRALAGRDTMAVAGGQTLIPLLRLRMAAPRKLVDIGGLRQLKRIRRTSKGIRIGAGCTWRELLDSAELRRMVPVMTAVVEHIGDRQVRNLGTIGGSLAHADPASDMPAVLLALDAVLTAQSRRGRRSIPARQFFLGAFTTALRPNELLTDVTVPVPPRRAGWAYETFEQPASGYALVGAAAVVARTKGAVSHAALAFTGLAEKAFLADAAAGLIGTKGGRQTVAKVADASVAGVEANDDLHASSAYRLHLARVAARRALERALAGAK